MNKNLIRRVSIMELAKRVQSLTPSSTLAITAKAKELKEKGIRVINFGAGEPDFNTPEHIMDAATIAMKRGFTKYTPAGGIMPLKKAICKKLEIDNGLIYDTNQIIVCSGAKHALYNVFQVICNPGDEVIVPIPYWVSYPEQVKLAGATPVTIRGEEQNGFKITLAQIEQSITPKTKVLILNSPSNPTGIVYSREELIEIGSICEKHQIWIISDEIYEKLIYDNIEHVSIASLSKALYNKTIVINGMSKPYSMTGWRIGYAAGNEEVISAMTDLSSHSTSNPTSIAQYAALEALEGTQKPLHSMKEAFKVRRDLIVSLLNEIPGIDCFFPEGAFYVFVNMNNVIAASSFSDVDEWAKQLLEIGHVAVIPGSGFGAPEFIRLSYAVSSDEIEIGIGNIRKFIENNTK